MTQYCTTHSFLINYNQNSNAVAIIVYLMYGLLSIYIILKMCQLCSKAFSYTNFHIHQAYKLYSIALLSTFLITISRITQFNMFSKDAVTAPEIKSEGWVILNQIIGIMTIFAMNELHLLAAITWYMVYKKCDFNEGSAEHIDVDNPEQTYKTHKILVIIRKTLLYCFIPVCLIISVFGMIFHSQGWCLTSRIISTLSCIVTCIFFIFAFSKILIFRFGSSETSKKTKLIWGYLIIMMMARFVIIIAEFIQDLDPDQGAKPALGKDFLILFLYIILITILPILLLSYIAEKQLSHQRQQKKVTTVLVSEYHYLIIFLSVIRLLSNIWRHIQQSNIAL